MNDININARISLKNDTLLNWNKLLTFVPKNGLMIIYNPDSTHTVARFKVGDGNAYLIDLPFVNELLLSHINNNDIHVSAADRALWNSKVSAEYNGLTLILQ